MRNTKKKMELKKLYIKKSSSVLAQKLKCLAQARLGSGTFQLGKFQLELITTTYPKMWRRLWMFPYRKTLLIGDLSSDSTAHTWKCCHSKNRKRYINKIKTILLFLLVWKAGLVRHWLKNWLLIFDSLSYLIMEKHFYFLLQFIYHTT